MSYYNSKYNAKEVERRVELWHNSAKVVRAISDQSIYGGMANNIEGQANSESIAILRGLMKVGYVVSSKARPSEKEIAEGSAILTLTKQGQYLLNAINNCGDDKAKIIEHDRICAEIGQGINDFYLR